SFDAVTDGTRRSTHARKLDGCGNVKRHADEKNDSHYPEQLSVGEFRLADCPEESRVSVDLVRAGKHLKIPDHVADHEADEHHAGYRHDDLLTDYCAPQSHYTVAGCIAVFCLVSIETNRRHFV